MIYLFISMLVIHEVLEMLIVINWKLTAILMMTITFVIHHLDHTFTTTLKTVFTLDIIKYLIELLIFISVLNINIYMPKKFIFIIDLF